MKRIFSVTLMVIIVCLSFTVNAFSSRMTDNDGLLNFDEELSLSEKFDEISENTNIDVAALTVETLGNKSPMTFADDYYDENGYGVGKNGGVLLVICLSSRDWYITTAGDAISIFSDSYIDKIGSKIKGYLADGDYYGAIDKYADMCLERIEDKQYDSQYDDRYDSQNYGTYTFADKMRTVPWFWLICIALAIGFIAAIITVSVMKSKLRSVRYQSAAGEYVRDGSFNLTEKSDHYLYCTVTRTERPKDNDNSSSHTSSSGASHGGGGGKF